MKVAYIVELVVCFLLFILCYLVLKNGKRRKRKITLTILIINLCIIGHVSMGYYLEKPMIQLIGEPVVVLDVNQEYIEQGASAKYHNQDYTNKIQAVVNLDTNKIGTYEVSYQVSYLDKTEEIKRIVIVKDRVNPEIILEGKTEINVPSNEEYKEQGYQAKDNYDGDITNQVTVEKQIIKDKKYKLVYSVVDASGNKTTAERIIDIIEPIKKPETENKIYLTFDDGPSMDITPKILDILKEENIKATFFILNYDSNREYLVKRIVNEGHTIAIHGYSHDYSTIYQSEETYMENITKLQEKIKASTGVETRITRFPGGSSNTVSKYNPGIMTKLTDRLLREHYSYFDWNVSSEDAGSAKTKEDTYHNVVKELKTNRANVVLMHDFSKNYKTLDSLKAIIEYGKANGYVFDKITQDTPMVRHRVSN